MWLVSVPIIFGFEVIATRRSAHRIALPQDGFSIADAAGKTREISFMTESRGIDHA
jgi:hypothetical protein